MPVPYDTIARRWTGLHPIGVDASRACPASPTAPVQAVALARTHQRTLVALSRPPWVLLPLASVAPSIEERDRIGAQLRNVAKLAAAALPTLSLHLCTMVRCRRPSASQAAQRPQG